MRRHFSLRAVLSVLFSLALFRVSAELPVYTPYPSPDKSIYMSVFQQNHQTWFNVMLNREVLIDQSPLGIVTSDGVFDKDLKIKNVRSFFRKEKYDLDNGKKSHVKYSYHQVIYSVQNPEGQEMDIIFRISDDGVAYCYKLYGEGETHIVNELGGYRFAPDSWAYMSPLSAAKSGWAKTNPSYEENYPCVAVGTPSPYGIGWTYPALFRVQNKAWVLLSETGVDGSYVGTHLAHSSEGGLYRIAFPNEKEGLPEQPSDALVTLPYTTPWRMMVCAPTLAGIVSSTMSTDLVEPKYEPKYEYNMGRATWSWITEKDASINYDKQVEFINLASEMGYEYCLVDAYWDKQIGYDRMELLADYAATKGVKLILWYNSNGQWNEAPQTPKDKMSDPEARRNEMAWMQNLGIKGIKVDFFGGDKQFYMQLYEDILRDANDFGLMVNFHGATLPRGWERMYPNFASTEAVKGMEFITFDQSTADNAPAHCATVAFTRNVVAPMDFTPMVLHERLGDRLNNGPHRATTAAFELALPVIFQSGIQHFGLHPDDMNRFPSEVYEYLRRVPSTWDDTQLLYACPAEECVIARRSGSVWYVAGINGENEEKTVEFSIRFLPARTRGYIIRDVKGGHNSVEVLEITTPRHKKDKLQLPMAPCGGFVLIFEKN